MNRRKSAYHPEPDEQLLRTCRIHCMLKSLLHDKGCQLVHFRRDLCAKPTLRESAPTVQTSTDKEQRNTGKATVSSRARRVIARRATWPTTSLPNMLRRLQASSYKPRPTGPTFRPERHDTCYKTALTQGQCSWKPLPPSHTAASMRSPGQTSTPVSHTTPATYPTKRRAF